ncbi:hypothetical protein [Sporosarcina sp. Te-1]|uniref:hypothetical protein n=1 Tax=Sporosarcina sp. Te-1 TaxID=2818390 RepID=UPI001A9E3373|nr:hypothetical protein [Sporosarcina sp. Te-1]QTD40926.1 hypothetical protein J3U78_19645 [Sporosarcina sp. Te-1]
MSKSAWLCPLLSLTLLIGFIWRSPDLFGARRIYLALAGFIWRSPDLFGARPVYLAHVRFIWQSPG